MVLFAIIRSARLRSMTNFFLANLAVADFCVGVFCVLPNLSTFLSQRWVLGRVSIKDKRFTLLIILNTPSRQRNPLF